MTSRDFEFVSAGRRLSGIHVEPSGGDVRALTVFVHGSGTTDVRRGVWFDDVRRRLVELGIASVVWDKPGQGRSEGEFNDNQPLESRAQEVLDAVAAARTRSLPGAERIVIWSTSGGSGAAPIALSQDPTLLFWISVSGRSDEDNKYYLMESNLPLEGRSATETAQLMSEWREGRRIFFSGGSLEAYLAATPTLRADPAVAYFAGDRTPTPAEYAAEQQAFLEARDSVQINERTTSVIQIRDFEPMLSRLNINVLALFGDKDTNLDWRRTRDQYEETIGRNPKASLVIHTFPGCNHSMNRSATGSVREVESPPPGAERCAGYLTAQTDWLTQHVLGE